MANHYQLTAFAADRTRVRSCWGPALVSATRFPTQAAMFHPGPAAGREPRRYLSPFRFPEEAGPAPRITPMCISPRPHSWLEDGFPRPWCDPCAHQQGTGKMGPSNPNSRYSCAGCALAGGQDSPPTPRKGHIYSAMGFLPLVVPSSPSAKASLGFTTWKSAAEVSRCRPLSPCRASEKQGCSVKMSQTLQPS